jgi:hypothetical protein
MSRIYAQRLVLATVVVTFVLSVLLALLQAR